MVHLIDGECTWGFKDLYNVNKQNCLKKVGAQNAILSPIKAHTEVVVWGSYVEPDSGKVFTDSVTIYVVPNKPGIVTIEEDWQKPVKGSNPLWYKTEIDTVYIGEVEEYKEGFYAIFRDEYENWIGPVDQLTNSSWGILDAKIAAATCGDDPIIGEGRITRKLSINGGLTRFFVTTQDNFKDSAVVKLSRMYSVECIPLPNPFYRDSLITGFEEFENSKGVLFSFPFLGKVGQFSKAKKITISICDVTGNEIAFIEKMYDDIIMKFNVLGTYKNKKIDALALVHWNGKNKKGRNVSTGSYVATIQFEDNNGFRLTKTKMISLIE